MSAEEKILGKKAPVKKEAPKSKANYFTSENIWEVEKDGCGVSVFNGRMAFELMDKAGKKQALSGAKEFANNGYKFKRVK